MTFRLAAPAEADIERALSYLLDHDPEAASRLLHDVLQAIRRLDGRAFEGPETTLRTGETVRSWPVPPYRVYYRREAGILVVLRVYHQRRTPM